MAGRTLLRFVALTCCTTRAAGVCLVLEALLASWSSSVRAMARPCVQSVPREPQPARAPHGADSEVGRLRTVMLHRPGPELKRLTPRNNDKLLFDGIPWVARAQDEHDAFADDAARPRRRGALPRPTCSPRPWSRRTPARTRSRRRWATSTSATRCAATSRACSATRRPAELTGYLTAGIRNDEVRGGFGLVTSLLAHDDFLIDPLPNLLFTRDSSVWVRDRVTITSLAMPARKRETELTELIYTEHPRFAGTPRIHGAHLEHVEGGDVLLLAPGVIAVGVGERTTPAGVERLARQCFQSDLAHTVLAVPIAQERATMHLDTICTLVDVDKMVVYPNVADSLVAYSVTPTGDVERRRRPASSTSARPSRSWSPRPRRWASTRCTRSTPASTRSPPSASSGTTATTPWRSHPGSRSPTSATTRPTPASRTPASRWSGSPAPSSAPVAAARAA